MLESKKVKCTPADNLRYADYICNCCRGNNGKNSNNSKNSKNRDCPLFFDKV